MPRRSLHLGNEVSGRGELKNASDRPLMIVRYLKLEPHSPHDGVSREQIAIESAIVRLPQILHRNDTAVTINAAGELDEAWPRSWRCPEP